MQPKISLYALINPINKCIFYVGASFDPWQRLQHHIVKRNSEKGFKAIQIREIIENNRKVELLVLDECDLGDVSFWEEFYIDLFKSWGFKINQANKSTYSQTNLNRFFKKEFTKTRYAAYISTDLPIEILHLLGEPNEYEIHYFVENAVKEKLDSLKKLKTKQAT